MVGRCSSRSSHCWTVHCMHPCLCLSLSFHLLLQLPLQLGRWTMASDDDDTVVCRGRRGCTVGLDTPMFRRFVVVSPRPAPPPYHLDCSPRFASPLVVECRIRQWRTVRSRGLSSPLPHVPRSPCSSHLLSFPATSVPCARCRPPILFLLPPP